MRGKMGLRLPNDKMILSANEQKPFNDDYQNTKLCQDMTKRSVVLPEEGVIVLQG